MSVKIIKWPVWIKLHIIYVTVVSWSLWHHFLNMFEIFNWNISIYRLENVPNTEQLFTCPDGMVCTNLPNICFQRNLLPASCGDTSSCGICNSNQVFACTSRTTFAFCFGAPIPSDTVGTCPVGTTCDSSSPYFCVEELEVIFLNFNFCRTNVQQCNIYYFPGNFNSMQSRGTD